MRVLKEISDASIGIGPDIKLGENYQLRKSARVILKNESGQIALQNLQNYGFYKLPGGCVDAGETIEETLMREVKEEVGCNCIITAPVGIVIEYRDKYKMMQINYCYVAEVVGSLSEPQFEENEIEAGQTNVWVSGTEALNLLKNSSSDKYESKFNTPPKTLSHVEY